MEGLNKLWEYQTAELEFEELESKLKNTPTRKQLLKLQKFLQSSQTKLIESENIARVKQDKITNFEARITTLNEELVELDKDLSYYSEANIDDIKPNELQELIKGYEKITEEISSIQKQIIKIRSDVEFGNKKSRDTIQKMKQVMPEFNELKAMHVKELEDSSQELAELRQKMLSAQSEVPEMLLKRYKSIKGNRPNPVAILSNSRCSGCNMQLPSGVASTVKNSSTPIECENCGRILYVPAE